MGGVLHLHRILQELDWVGWRKGVAGYIGSDEGRIQGVTSEMQGMHDFSLSICGQ